MKKFFIAALLALTANHANAAASDFRVTLLGTGVPVPSAERFGPSTLVEVDGKTLLFDAGRGVTQRIWQLGIPLGKVDAVFITHFHSDHTVGLPDLLLTGWLDPAFGQRKRPLTIYGPEGMVKMARSIEDAYSNDIAIRTVDEHLNPDFAKFDAHEFTEGVVYDKDGVKVTAFPVFHGVHIHPAFGFSVEYGDEKIVISGDTKYDKRVVAEATGVALLVHCVVAIDPKAEAQSSTLQDIANHMASPEDVGRVLLEAKPRMAVFTHIGQVPPNPPSADELLARAKVIYNGPVVMGHDLLSFEIGKDTTTVIDRAPAGK